MTIAPATTPPASVDDGARLARRAVIDRAKLMLMATHGMTEPEAYRWIQKSAMDSRLPMVAIATRIVEPVDLEAEPQTAARAS